MFLQVYWSDSGELCAIATDDTIFILKYNPDKVSAALENRDEISEDGVEEAFDVSLNFGDFLVLTLQNLVFVFFLERCNCVAVAGAVVIRDLKQTQR